MRKLIKNGQENGTLLVDENGMKRYANYYKLVEKQWRKTANDNEIGFEWLRNEPDINLAEIQFR